MKKKIIFAVAAFSVAAAFSAFCEESPKDEVAVQEQATETEAPNPESDFDIDFNEDITEVYITAYKGESDKIIIPETIQGLPVTKIVSIRNPHIWTIEKILIPSSVSQIERVGAGVHYTLGTSTQNGTEVVLPEGLAGIDEEAFRYAEIPSVTFPSTLKYIKAAAFAETKLKEITLKESLEYIGPMAFCECTIESLTLPSSLKYVGLCYPLSRHTFDMSASELNLPEDISGWHYVLYDSKKGYESEVESESYSVSLFNIISSPSDSQNVAVRRMQKKLENTNVQKADFKEFEDFYKSYFGSNLKEIFYPNLYSDK